MRDLRINGIRVNPVRRCSPLVGRAVRCIRDRCHSNLTTTSVTTTLSMTRTHLRGLFHHRIDIPLKQCVGSHLFCCTRRRLHLASHAVGSVDRQLNFYSPFCFSHVFTTHCNMSPQRCHGKLVPWSVRGRTYRSANIFLDKLSCL